MSYILLCPRSFIAAAKVISGWAFVDPAVFAAEIAADAGLAFAASDRAVDSLGSAGCVAEPFQNSLHAGEAQTDVACVIHSVQPAVCRVCRSLSSEDAFCE